MEVTVHLDVRGQPLETRTVAVPARVSFRELVETLELAFEMPLRILALRDNALSASSDFDSRSMSSLLESWEAVRFQFRFRKQFSQSLFLFKRPAARTIDGGIGDLGAASGCERCTNASSAASG
jgi:hypothetical protein